MPYRLATQGFDLVQALSPAAARGLTARLGPGEIAFLESPKLAEVESALAPMLDGNIGNMARGLFRSDFIVAGIGFRRKIGGVTDSLPAEKGSSYWHCDGGPRDHLKVLAYLSDADAHDGGTAFIDRVTTDVFKRAGCVFQPLNDRISDLQPVAREHGFAFEETLLKPQIGEAIVFQPSQVLHRGVVPKRGVRETMVLLLLPSSASWRDILTANFEAILANHAAGFPRLEQRVRVDF